MDSIFRKIRMLIILIILVLISYIAFSDNETYIIKYIVKNNPNSTDIMKGISLPKENIKVPDFIELSSITPDKPIDIEKGEKQEFIINFKLKDDLPASAMSLVKIKLKYDQQKQCIIPIEDSILLEDKKSPTYKTVAILPGQVNADEPQNIYISAISQDDWSGIKTDQQLTVSIGQNNSFISTITSLTNNRECKIEGTTQSPEKEGTYDVIISQISDNAGNTTPSQQIGTLTVKPSLKDQPADPRVPRPDESLDIFGSTLSGNFPPRFGAAKIAILGSGYALEMRDLLANFSETADFVSPSELTPSVVAKYKVLIVPSAALARLENIPNLREKFSAYVSAGGTLLVMAQPMDTCYKLLR